MTKKKHTKIGTIHSEDVKVRKKIPPSVQVQKSVKDYDRKCLKQKIRKELDDD